MGVIFPHISWLFTLFEMRRAGGRVCRTGSSCLPFCARRAAGVGKNPVKSRRPMWPGGCYGTGGSFWQSFVRASATSRISPSVALAPQTSNANKADDTSPFAQLLNAVGTTSQKDASKDASGDKARDDKAQSDKAQSHAPDAKDVKTGAAQTPVRPRHTRTDKDDTKSETAKSTNQPAVDSSGNPREDIKPVVPPQALPVAVSTATETPASDDVGTQETKNGNAPPPIQPEPGKPDGQVASAPADGQTAASQDGAAAPLPRAPIPPASVAPGAVTAPVAGAPDTGHINNNSTAAKDTGTSASSKPAKPTKPEDQAKDGDTYNSGLTTADLQLVSQQFLQPAQGPGSQPAIVPLPVATDTDEMETVAAPSASASAASAAASAAATPPANTTAPQGSAARRAAQAAAQSAASVQTDGDQAEDVAAATKADIAALKTQSAAAARKTQPAANGTTDANKADENKTGDFKIAGTDGKPDTKTDAGTKSDPNQPVVPQTVVDQPQPRPAPAQPVNTNFTVHDITASQAPPPGTSPVAASAAAQIEQHVRVSTPQPDLPALAVQIVTKSQGGARQFDIRLDPPELGHVDVRLSIDATGKASAHVTADQPQTLELLQKDASTLTRALRDAGLDVSQNGLNFSLRQQNSNGFGGDNNSGGGRSPSRGALSLQASRSIEAASSSISYRAPADGRVDISV
jgi:flagellar hook-length control protein FliK